MGSLSVSRLVGLVNQAETHDPEELDSLAG
jgi:hypothetical protein